jgi:hypothetical protein
MRLSLVISDFHWEHGQPAATQLAVLPALPALGELLRRSVRRLNGSDWRSGLAWDLGLSGLAGMTPAAVVARAVPGAVIENGLWLAAPVHRVAGMSRVQLHPAGLLRLSRAEAVALHDSFNAEFSSEGLRLHVVGDGFLLEGIVAGSGTDEDPAAWLGAELSAAPSTTEADRQRRKFQAEVEMWLHGHALNGKRETQGQLAMNGFWLWGGATTLSQSTGQLLPASGQLIAFGSDPFLSGVTRYSGLGDPRPASGFAEVDAGDAVAVVSAAALDSRDSPLQRLEALWFEPVLKALEAGTVSSLRMRLGASAWQVSPPWRTWLRRSVPWWERLY